MNCEIYVYIVIIAMIYVLILQELIVQININIDKCLCKPHNEIKSIIMEVNFIFADLQDLLLSIQSLTTGIKLIDCCLVYSERNKIYFM